jgi:hypothetical protein
MLLGSAVALLPAGAFGLPISGDYAITTGGLNTGSICQFGAQCNADIGNFSYAPPGAGYDAAAGTITIDAEGQTLSLDFTVSGASFEGSLNGVDQVLFGQVRYSGTGLTFSEVGGQLVIGSGQSITVAGTYEQFLGGAPVVGATALDTLASVASGICNDTDLLVCSFNFGPGNTQNSLAIGSPAVNRRFLHGFTVDPVIVVPEPSTLLLVGAGLLALRWRSRRKSTD